jgi:hypothetical protein
MIGGGSLKVNKAPAQGEKDTVCQVRFHGPVNGGNAPLRVWVFQVQLRKYQAER